jgi:hypothetical protein
MDYSMSDLPLITHRYFPEKRLNHHPELLLALMSNRVAYEFNVDGETSTVWAIDRFNRASMRFCEIHNKGWWSSSCEAREYNLKGKMPGFGEETVGVRLGFIASFEFEEDMHHFIKDFVLPYKLGN